MRARTLSKPATTYLALSVTLLASGCDDGVVAARPDSGPSPDAPTYYADVAPLLQRECLSCHVDGGIGPFPLDSYEAARETAENVVDAVEAEYMPPWLPNDQCREYAHARGLTADERAVFTAWLAGGLQEGDPAEQPPPPEGPPELETTDIARMVEPYTPDSARPDDYRCFLLDHELAADAFVTGRNVVPGARSLVHHVLVYGVPSDLVPTVEAIDAADDGPGYTCFGGPIPDDSESQRSSLGLIGLGGWVPGQQPFVEREGRGVYVPAGTRLVMQVHYNLLSEDPVPDETEVHLQITETEPSLAVTTFPTAILDLDIPAGEPDARHEMTFRNYRSEELSITALTPHMHLLGEEIGMDRVPALGAEGDPACLIDIPRWDFDWQQSYFLREDEPVTLAPGEGLRLTCSYDNSPTNQPVVNGERVEPRDVTWGEGTLDEMCLLYVQHETPWEGPPATGCDALADCRASCTESDTECLLACEGLGGDCRVCALEGTLGCARDACLASFFPAADCLTSCIASYAMLGGSFERCAQTECPDEWPAVIECVSTHVEGGSCDAQLAGCGITF